jgi:hypothetical protein
MNLYMLTVADVVLLSVGMFSMGFVVGAFLYGAVESRLVRRQALLLARRRGL